MLLVMARGFKRLQGEQRAAAAAAAQSFFYGAGAFAVHSLFNKFVFL
jgi:hypothetical protein